jgi:hypothetical protein
LQKKRRNTLHVFEFVFVLFCFVCFSKREITNLDGLLVAGLEKEVDNLILAVGVVEEHEETPVDQPIHTQY